jgi:hypothetical protein
MCRPRVPAPSKFAVIDYCDYAAGMIFVSLGHSRCDCVPGAIQRESLLSVIPVAVATTVRFANTSIAAPIVLAFLLISPC